MKKIVVFGSGSHAKVVFYEILKIKKFKIIGFIDEKLSKGKIIIKCPEGAFRCIGKISEVINKKNNFSGIIAIANNFIREQVYNKITSLNKKFKFEKIISKNAIINSNVKIGHGSVVIGGSIINPDTVIGDHCLINTSASIDHDNILENFSSVGPGVITGGSVIIKKSSFIGIGSVIKNNITIDKNTLVGGNSFVNKNCKKDSIYYGSPAVKIKKNYFHYS